MVKRKPLSKKERYAILARDGFTCRYCGAQPDSGVLLVVDHIHPVVLGGTNDPTNLITACQPCNAGKGAQAPDKIIPTEKDRLRLLQELAEQREALETTKAILAARQERDTVLVTMWCEIVGWDSVCDDRTLHSLSRWQDEFGPAVLAEWIQIAHDKLRGDSQYQYCRYIGGIARNVRERRAEKAERERIARLPHIPTLAEYGREPTTDDR